MTAYSQFDITNVKRMAPLLNAKENGNNVKDTKGNIVKDSTSGKGESSSSLDILTGIFVGNSQFKTQPAINLQVPIHLYRGWLSSGGYLITGLQSGDTTGDVSNGANFRRILVRELNIFNGGLSLHTNIFTDTSNLLIGFVGNINFGMVGLAYNIIDKLDTNKITRASKTPAVASADISFQIGFKDNVSAYVGYKYTSLSTTDLPNEFGKYNDFRNIFCGVSLNLSVGDKRSLGVRIESIFLDSDQRKNLNVSDKFIMTIRLNAQQSFIF